MVLFERNECLMVTKENKKERICSFYASDFHLEMIVLPYINKKLEEDKKVIIITEENLEESLKILISKINLEQNRKRKILNLDWKNNYIDKIEEVKENIENNKEIYIIVNGKEEFVENINNIIKDKDSINIVNCYKIEDIQDHIQYIVKKHEKVLNTSGLKEI